MKVFELKKANKIGRLVLNGIYLEAHEMETVSLLRRYGFDIEMVRPNNTPKSDNPDMVMMGTIWEMKAPKSTNKKTLKKRVHKASLQSGYVVFDLRRIDGEMRSEVEREILKRFMDKSTLRRMLIVRSNDEVVDFRK